FLFFFFQAEDGIRDLTVTGVQTCALPISRPMAEPKARCCASTGWHRPRVLRCRSRRHRSRVGRSMGVEARRGSVPSRAREMTARSEERRVGKECRWWWGGSACKEEVGDEE